jgi:hypothetical protein
MRGLGQPSNQPIQHDRKHKGLNRFFDASQQNKSPALLDKLPELALPFLQEYEWMPPMVMKQRSLFAEEESAGPSHRSGCFVDNMRLPIHRWYRYSAGFSAQWVGHLIADSQRGAPLHVLDPFVGSGTVVLEAARAGAVAMGLEAHPFISRIARAKLAWGSDVEAFQRLAEKVAADAEKRQGQLRGYPDLIVKCFPPETLLRLDALKKSWAEKNDGSPAAELCWLALVAILRETSPVGTAQWQYILPRKAKAKSAEPFAAFAWRVHMMAQDMRIAQQEMACPPGRVLTGDARSCPDIPSGWADLIVTSPPYANNYDYADATRLEMCFFGEISGWADLQSVVREHLIRSCTQHVASQANRSRELLQAPVLAPIAGELSQTYRRLEKEREQHGGKKPYHAMIAYYFSDLAEVWKSLRRVARSGARACFVVGDSAPYGIHVPVDRWLGELALAAGFRSYRFEKLRDRNTKWKNRKHRVLLHEGLLWVEG